MRCVIPGAPDLAKDLIDFVGKNAGIPQAAEQLVLRFLGSQEEASAGGQQLGEHFCELAQLNQASVRVVGEVLFSQHAQAEQLFVVLTQH